MARRNLSIGDAVPMEPGERNLLVTIQQLTETVSDAHEPGEDWTTLATIKMRKQDASMSERFKASQVSAAFDTQWEMGYRGDMDPDLVNVQKTRRLVYAGRTYDITGASLIGRRQGIELLTLAASGV